MMAADPIQAVREEDATGQVAATFADLRATLGIPFVNLIWRHLATIPGALEAVWTLVRPLYRGAALLRHAASLRDELRLPAGLALPPHAWDAAGVPRRDRAEIAALVDAYNLANSVNLLALLVAGSVLRGDAEPSQSPPPEPADEAPVDETPPTAAGAVRPLPGLADLPPPVLALVQELDVFGRLGPSDAIASLYRHLAYWPAFLAMAYATLRPHHASGALAAEQQRLIATARHAASDLGGRVDRGSFRLDAAERERALAGIDGFTQLMIGRMVVLGGALRAMLPPEG